MPDENVDLIELQGIITKNFHEQFEKEDKDGDNIIFSGPSLKKVMIFKQEAIVKDDDGDLFKVKFDDKYKFDDKDKWVKVEEEFVPAKGEAKKDEEDDEELKGRAKEMESMSEGGFGAE